MQQLLPIEFYSYYLTSPLAFQKKKERITEIPEGYSLLKTLKTGICASDLHYYLGLKSKEKLKERLPLILLHEGLCLDMERGTRVVPIAADLNHVDSSYVGRENIYPQSKYMGATAKGMAREYLLYPQNLLIPISAFVDDDVATLVEPLSIVLKALKDVQVQYHQNIAVIGDGGLAYLFALMLHFFNNISPQKVTIYGVHEDKLEKFANYGTTRNIRKSPKLDSADIVFEVVGGNKINDTLDAALQIVNPGGTIGIVGVSDDFPKIDVNKVVNRGIHLVGLTRSTYRDYTTAAELLKMPELHKAIKKFIYPENIIISSVTELKRAFNLAKNLPSYGRVVMSWDAEE